jgi:hypothetical protein
VAPGIVNFDIIEAKTFRIKERFRTQFRWGDAERLDAFNSSA